ncbi:hypothetical protein H5410_059788 [Solanum commersonii]|uniref:Uncharacterized protein n=1 Tax=Solanum commersonii TaxID=4109 RepID=A0A9J5W4J3_SOLCO|nr:hypothetical protein H5410_059788 [Solanum commersonii]
MLLSNSFKKASYRHKLWRDEESVTWKDERFQKEFDLRNRSKKDEDASSSKTYRIQGRYENWRSYSKKDQAFGDARVGIGCYWNQWFQ